MQIIQSIQNRIYEIRGVRVILDYDLASLYEVETRILNQAIKRNIKRFPDDFMFQVTSIEWEIYQKNIFESKDQQNFDSTHSSSQIVMMSVPKNRTNKYLPFAFTEQGVAMLSGVLNSDKAIQMNIAIMRAFVQIRHIIFQQNDLSSQMKEIKSRIDEHDSQLNQIYDAMENLLDEKARQRKWEEREKIGFKK